MLHTARHHKDDRPKSQDVVQAEFAPTPGPAALFTPQFTQEPSAQAVSSEVSHWSEAGGGRREWPEADGDAGATKPQPAGKPLPPLLDPKQNPDPTNEFAPKATYGEVKGVVGVKGEGDEHEFAPNDVEQGALGDCYFVAQLAAQARANPDRIKHLIKDNGDGTFTVTLHLKKGARRVATPIVVDSQFPQKDGSVAYAKPGDQGDNGPELWVMLIEKAFAKVSGSFENIRGKKTSDGDVFGMMSGVNSQQLHLGGPRDRILDTLSKAVAAGQPVVLGAKSQAAGDAVVAEMKAEGIVANHCYTLMDVDAKAGTVNLRNPWGVKHLNSLPIEKVQKYFNSCDIGAK